MTAGFVGLARGQLSLAFMSPHPPILLGTMSMADSLILMVMALVVFGPRRLPQIGKQIGKLMYEFRKASNDFKFQMEEELRNAEEADRRKKEEERQRALAARTASEQASVSADPPAPVASPYPGEGTYPPQYPPETVQDPPATAQPDLKAEDSAPKIMPPSTGEQVAAGRPSQSPSYFYSPEPNGQEPSTENSERAGSNEPGSSQPQNAPEALNEHG